MRIVFLDRSSIGPEVTLHRPGFAHDWVAHDRTAPDAVAARLAGADIAVSNKVPIRRATIEALPRLKMIAIPATGHDAFDVDACRQRGIVVSNVRGYAASTVPEHVFALILALRRNIVGYRRDVIDGRWQAAGQFCFFTHPIGDLRGATLGIFGRGDIGRATADIARAFGMEVLFAARKGGAVAPGYTAFGEVLARSDILTLHAPLTPDTRGMIALPEFRQMHRRPIVINCGRGGLVDEADLVTALNEGLIAGAGVDVLTTEPPAPDNPLLSVLTRPNVIVTPHVAWASAAAMQALWDQLIGHIENFVAGRPSNNLAG